jgi:hypothetical protein
VVLIGNHVVLIGSLVVRMVVQLSGVMATLLPAQRGSLRYDNFQFLGTKRPWLSEFRFVAIHLLSRGFS